MDFDEYNGEIYSFYILFLFFFCIFEQNHIKISMLMTIHWGAIVEVNKIKKGIQSITNKKKNVRIIINANIWEHPNNGSIVI